MSARADFALDLARYCHFGLGLTLPQRIALLLTTEALWVIATYRACRWAMRECRVPVLKPIATVVTKLHLRLLRVLMQTWISPQAEIGGGLFINHFGGIWINPDVKMGAFCNLHQGVTIGVGGRGASYGVPVLGSRVNLMPHAVVVGKLRIGDDVLVGANSLVISDVPDGCFAVGTPARVFRTHGSGIPRDPTRVQTPEEHAAETGTAPAGAGPVGALGREPEPEGASAGA